MGSRREYACEGEDCCLCELHTSIPLLGRADSDFSSLGARMLHLRGRWQLTGLVSSHIRFQIHSFILLHNIFPFSVKESYSVKIFVRQTHTCVTSAICMCDFVIEECQEEQCLLQLKASL